MFLDLQNMLSTLNDCLIVFTFLIYFFHFLLMFFYFLYFSLTSYFFLFIFHNVIQSHIIFQEKNFITMDETEF